MIIAKFMFKNSILIVDHDFYDILPENYQRNFLSEHDTGKPRVDHPFPEPKYLQERYPRYLASQVWRANRLVVQVSFYCREHQQRYLGLCLSDW